MVEMDDAQTGGSPTLTLLPSTTTTVVTTTTTTTTIYPPIPLPAPPSPRTLYPSLLSPSPTTTPHPSRPRDYPLLFSPLPPQAQSYFLPGVRARYHSGDPAIPPPPAPSTSSADARPSMLERGESWVRIRREGEAEGDILQGGSVREAVEKYLPIPAAPPKGQRKRMLSNPNNNPGHSGGNEGALNLSLNAVGRGGSVGASTASSTQSPNERDVRMSEGPPSPAPPSPPRKKARAHALQHQQHGGHSGTTGLHPLPSPSNSPPPLSPPPPPHSASTEHGPATVTTSSYSSSSPPDLPVLPLQTLLSLPALLTQYAHLPPPLQTHVLLSLLKLSPLAVLRSADGFITPALSRDFLSLLPTELSLQILHALDLRSLLRCCRVCRTWRSLIDNEAPLWRALLRVNKLWFDEPSRASLPPSMRLSAHQRIPPTYPATLRPPHPYKTLLRYRLRLQQVLAQPPTQLTIPLPTQTVVTCLQLSATRIVSASDEHTIHVHSPITGQLILSLNGHTGGVWALQFVHHTLVSGSTDRTVRVWDLRSGRNTHVFAGHTSTVRCLQIVERGAGGGQGGGGEWPKRRMVVTGSRDSTLRLWVLPREGEEEYKSPQSGEPEHTDRDEPNRNPYHVRVFTGHTSAVRALAARGRTLVSGSYDCTVRVWDLATGECRFVLTGHAQKVYSVTLDPIRPQCASGSMDGTVRIWCLQTGQCLHALSGHTSLVGLLSLRPTQLISAAADSTLRVWSPETGALVHTLTGHPAAITCFLHDEFRVLSGSEGSLKMWDAERGEWKRDLLVDVGGVWQVAGWGRRVVSACNRGDETFLDVFEWGGDREERDDGFGVEEDVLDDDASVVTVEEDEGEGEGGAEFEDEDDPIVRSLVVNDVDADVDAAVSQEQQDDEDEDMAADSYEDALDEPGTASSRGLDELDELDDDDDDDREEEDDEVQEIQPWELKTPTPLPRARRSRAGPSRVVAQPQAGPSRRFAGEDEMEL